MKKIKKDTLRSANSHLGYPSMCGDFSQIAPSDWRTPNCVLSPACLPEIQTHRPTAALTVLPHPPLDRDIPEQSTHFSTHLTCRDPSLPASVNSAPRPHIRSERPPSCCFLSFRAPAALWNYCSCFILQVRAWCPPPHPPPSMQAPGAQGLCTVVLPAASYLEGLNSLMNTDGRHATQAHTVTPASLRATHLHLEQQLKLECASEWTAG